MGRNMSTQDESRFKGFVRWEYKTLEVGQSQGSSSHNGKSFEEELNRLGNQGWELVGRGMNNGKIYNHLVFKREIK